MQNVFIFSFWFWDEVWLGHVLEWCLQSRFLFQYVLAVGSSVFHAMFYGELAEDNDEIRIPDVEPPSFLAMLKYSFQSC